MERPFSNHMIMRVDMVFHYTGCLGCRLRADRQVEAIFTTLIFTP